MTSTKKGEKGDWLDLIFERWGFFIGDKNNFKDEIRKGHEADLLVWKKDAHRDEEGE